MINLDHSGKRRGTDFGRALARLILATAIALGAAAFAARDGSLAAAARQAFGPIAGFDNIVEATAHQAKA